MLSQTTKRLDCSPDDTVLQRPGDDNDDVERTLDRDNGMAGGRLDIAEQGQRLAGEVRSDLDLALGQSPGQPLRRSGRCHHNGKQQGRQRAVSPA